MIDFIKRAAPLIAAHFNPSKARMTEITEHGDELIAKASDEDLDDFQE